MNDMNFEEEIRKRREEKRKRKRAQILADYDKGPRISERDRQSRMSETDKSRNEFRKKWLRIRKKMEMNEDEGEEK